MPFRSTISAPWAGMLVIVLWALGGTVAAEDLRVADLLALCDRAAASGFQGPEGAACEWYAVPCACKLRDPGSGSVPWCVPASESIDATRDKVLAGLRAGVDPSGPAADAVAAILARLYPCASERSGR
jgi:hypothetical protein